MTSQELMADGWKYIASLKNGGSMLFERDEFKILFHGNNFIFNYDEDTTRMEEIDIYISKFKYPRERFLKYRGKIITINELNLKINELKSAQEHN